MQEANTGDARAERFHQIDRWMRGTSSTLHYFASFTSLASLRKTEL